MGIEKLPSGVPHREPLSNTAHRFAKTLQGKSIAEIHGLVSVGGTESRMHLIEEIARNGRESSTRDIAAAVLQYDKELRDRNHSGGQIDRRHDPF